jgi:integrase/recombinase XerD
VRIRAAAEGFLDELRARRASASLLTQTSRTLSRLSSHLRAKRVSDLSQIEERHLVSFARRLRDSKTPRGTPLSLSSQASYLQPVKSLFAFLERRGLLLRSPAADLVIPRASPLPRATISEGQAARLMEAPSQETSTGKRDRAILETLYGMGMRRGECARLDVADLDLDAGTLLVRDGKGRKDRMVPVPGRAAAALGAYLRDVRPRLVEDPTEPALFLTAWWGHRLSEISISFLLRRHAKAAGIGKVHPHALRHACATHLLRGGADVRHVQAILGHKKLETTGLYTRVVIEDLREVFVRSHPRDRARRGSPSSKIKGEVRP